MAEIPGEPVVCKFRWHPTIKLLGLLRQLPIVVLLVPMHRKSHETLEAVVDPDPVDP